MNQREIEIKWNQLFEREYIRDQVLEIAEKFPVVSSLNITLEQLEAFDLLDDLEMQPEAVLELGKGVLAQHIADSPFDVEDIDPVQLSIRPTCGALSLNIRDIRHWHRGKLVEFEGIVRRCSELGAAITKAAYLCKRCENRFFLNINDIRHPNGVICPNPSCCRNGPFVRIEEDCEFTDIQWLTIQEAFDSLEDGKKEPKRIDVLIKGDMTAKAGPGDRVRAVGIVKYVQKSKKSKEDEYVSHLDGLYLEVQGSDYREIEINETEEQSIIQESRDPEILEKLIESVAPSIIGYPKIKLGLLMQQVSGCTMALQDGIQSRGEIHILLIGDPSVGKSFLLMFISNLAPRCAVGAGGGASGVGITASVIKDEKYGWVVEAGVMPLANGGTAIVDEFDKLKDDDRAKLHEALEQSQIHIDKASIHAVLPTRCSLLAAANPKMGRFDLYEPIGPQINLTPALLSRFDLIFVMNDHPDQLRDEEIASHILSGSIDKKPPIDMDFLRKYLAYARRLHPKMNKACERKLIAYYTQMRRNGFPEDSIQMLPRSLQTLRRMAEASAKLRLSEDVIEDDAALAITVYEAAFSPLISRDGRLDVDKIELGISSVDRDRIKQIMQVIRDLSLCNMATLPRILEKASEHGIPAKNAMNIVIKLKGMGDIMEYSDGVFKTSE